MGGLSWLSEFFQFLGSLVPRLAVVRATHGAVKFVRGSNVKELKPGLHVYWPFITDFLEIPTARTTYNFSEQVVMTVDEKPLAVSGVLVYQISDVVKALSQSYDVEDTIGDVGCTAIMETLSGSNLKELMEGQRDGELCKTLTRTTRSRLHPFGVKVISAALTDFATCTVLKIMGGTGAPAVISPEVEE
jgi:regulator of protease activity HflC (stomatin/prohibitin superfamily)